MAIHALTVMPQRRLLADVAAYGDSVDLRVAPPLCPLAVSPADFGHAGELLARAGAVTRGWITGGIPADPVGYLAPHRH